MSGYVFMLVWTVLSFEILGAVLKKKSIYGLNLHAFEWDPEAFL